MFLNETDGGELLTAATGAERKRGPEAAGRDDRVRQELKFTVLGPVRGWHGDIELNLGAPQQRAVLVLLLLAEGRQVTLDALINGLWEDDPPPAAVGAVRTYVSKLRQAIKVAAGEHLAGVIESAGTGYVLRVDSVALDLSLFEQMAADARTLKAGNRAEKAQAAALLRDAFRLGQGEPLADIPGPYARWQRVRISELQLAANEERLALDIELGEHTAAAAELQTLLASYPVRERLSELLMLALYRSGRQIDALAVFDNLRRLLAEEFGVDPGPALQEMQQRILRTDDSLIGSPQHVPPQGGGTTTDGSPETAPVPAAPAVPAQLPADLPVFAGRRRELARLDMLRADDGESSAAVTIAVIDGMAGMGKTALAVHWACQVAGQFPDGQLYVNLRGFDPVGAPMTPGEALRGFLEALGVAPQRIPDDLDAQASLYRSMLRGRRILLLLDNAYDLTQVRPLLPGSPGCLVIVTSRNRLLGLVTAHGARGVTLEALPTEEARETLAARLGAARFTAEPHALEEILDYCAGLPLALAVVAARAAVYDDFSLRDMARELRDAATRLDALSTDDASADVRAVFSWSYQLLSEPARQLFRLLSVTCRPDVTRNAVASVVGLSRSEVQPLLAELTGAGLLTEHRLGHFAMHDLTRIYAGELSAAHDATPVEKAHLHSIFGAIFAQQALYDQAVEHYRQAHAYSQAANHQSGQADALRGSGACYGQQGQYSEATRMVHDAMAIYRKLEDCDGEGGCWLTLGEFHHLLGEHEQALACQQRAVTLYRRVGNRAGEAQALDRLGDSALAAGKRDRAHEAWQTALIVLNELGLPAAEYVRRKLHLVQETGSSRRRELVCQ